MAEYIISSGVISNGITLENDSMSVLDGGVANNTTISQGGLLNVKSGGTATNVVWTPCVGKINIDDGAKVSFVNKYSGVYFGSNNTLLSHDSVMESVVFSNGTMCVMSDGKAIKPTAANWNASVCVYNGGIVSSALLSRGRMVVSSGGYADYTTVNSNGGVNGLVVCYGGVANNTTINDNSGILVSGGGKAINTIVNSGSMSVLSGGTADYTSVKSQGILYVSSGGTATNIIWTPCDGTLKIDNDAYVTFASQYSGVYYRSNNALVHESLVKDKTLNNICVTSNGSATNIFVSSGGRMYVFEGGVVESSLVSGYMASVFVYSGGMVKSTTLNYEGRLDVFRGGSVNAMTVDLGQLYVYNGGYASSVTIIGKQDRSWGDIYNFGRVDDVIIEDYGDYYVCEGGVTSKTTINTSGGLEVSSGGLANNTLVNNYGYIKVFNGGIASGVSVKSAGSLTVFSGGTASDVKISRGAVISFDVASSTFLHWTSSGTTFEMKDAFISDYAIVSGGQVRVLDEGVVQNLTLNNGSLCVSSGGKVNSIKQEMGQITVSSGGTITGRMLFADVDGAGIFATAGAIIDFDLTQTSVGATALVNNLSLIQGAPDYTVTVKNNQELGLYSLADVVEEFDKTITVKNTAGEKLGTLTVGSSLEAESRQYTLMLEEGNLNLVCDSIPTTGIVIGNNQSVSIGKDDVYLNTTVTSGGQFHVSSGGIATNTTITPGGSMFISSGGTATDILWTPCEGHVYVRGGDATFVNKYSGVYYGANNHLISSGTELNSKTLGMGEEMNVMSGGTADNTSIQIFASMFVSSGVAVNNTKVNGGAFYISSGGTANNTAVNEDGHMYVSSGGIVNNTTISGGFLEAQDKGVANSTNIYSGGHFYITSGSIVKDTTVYGHGNLFVSSGGIASETKVYAGGTLELKDCAVITGKISFATGAIVLADQSAVVDFDLTSLSAGEKALLNDWSLIQGTPQYSITVRTNQEEGIYKLADTAGEFDGVITVKGPDGESLGTFKAGESFEVGEDTYTLRIDNDSLVLSIAETHPADTVAPTISNIQASLTEPTNQDVVLTADFADDVELTSSLYKFGENGEWTTYVDGVTVKENGIVYFKAIDAAGNESEVASYTVSNIDKVEPGNPSGLLAVVSNQTVALLWNVSMDDSSGVKEYIVTYSLNGQEFTARTANSNYVLNNADFGSYSWSVQAVDFAGNESAVVAGDAFTVSGFKPYTVEYSADNFEHVITFAVTTLSLDAFRMPTGTYQLRIKQEGSSEWLSGDSIVATELDATPQLIKSDADGNADIFFANPIGTWESGYVAQHVGSIGDWTGTNEYTTLFGKNKLADIIEGSTDANILLMTDDDNGDTLFVDDIYTASPGGIAEKQSRIAQIDEIRAGAGNDIVDMTSQNFEYIGDGLTIRGGEGNDTIWANKGNNWLFGDAGNDRIVGASGNDVIAGGIGNDRMHGGGGKDMFTFCENWGVDNVEQLAGSEVVLWFAEGSQDNWDASKLTYTDGTNSVKVSGVTADLVTLKFGDDGSDDYAALAASGAFFDATTERIFEEEGKGMLASL